MQDYNELVKKSLDLKEHKKQRHYATSKERLLSISIKKIKTTMIGALAAVEKHFSFLWENVDSESAQKLKILYEEMRAEILDRGNTQIRNLEAEFSNYDISWNKYNITLPVIQNTQEG